MSEAKFQAELIKKLRLLFPDCIILKNDSGYLQGIPDLVIFYGARYGFLELKVSERALNQPNQEYYIRKINEMSFAAFICPSNEEEVLCALQRALCGI